MNLNLRVGKSTLGVFTFVLLFYLSAFTVLPGTEVYRQCLPREGGE